MNKTRNTPFMLISKIVLFVCLASMYYMQANVALPLYDVFHQTNIGGQLDVDFVLEILVVTVCIGLAAFILGIIGGAMREAKPYVVLTIVIKILMIPFFGINIYLWLLVMSGMLNPFLLFGIPAMAGIGVVLTYVYMFMTSLPDIIYTIIFLIKNRQRPNVFIVVGIIAMFFFVLDVVGAILLNVGYKKLAKARAEAEVQAV